EPKRSCSMSFNLRTTILATGCILAIGTSAARAQMPLVFYYSAPGNYATTQGTVNIPAAGYYYNVPLYAVPAPVNPAPAQGSTYSSFYYPRGGASTEGGGGGGAYEGGDERPSGAYVSGDNEDSPDW
ncbi:MAG: hypothetical protein ABSD28_21790, partial [Tepidisphaeraceae bacterium]